MLRHVLLTGFVAFFCLLFATSVAAQDKYEAENPQTTTITSANTKTTNGITYVQNLTQIGSAVAFSVSVPATGMYTLSSRYAAGHAYAWTMSLYVNNRDVAQLQFPSTADWSSWSTQRVAVYLRSGTNLVTYQRDADDTGYIDLDYITVAAAGSLNYAAGSAAAASIPTEIDVDKFTGTASVNLPLYTVVIPGVQLPIALHYSATGVQVKDEGGEVGLNWALQAGLSIRRQVRDLPDDLLRTSGAENRYGWLHCTNPLASIRSVPNPEASANFNSSSSTSTQETALANLLSLGSLNHQDGGNSSLPFTMQDTEPDIFTYAVPGYTGKFVFDSVRTVRLIPYTAVKIEPQFALNATTVTIGKCAYNATEGELTGFILTTPEGVVYNFDCPERIQQLSNGLLPVQPVSFFSREIWSFINNRTTSNTYYPSSRILTTGWLVTEIKTPAAIKNPSVASQYSIRFEYTCSGSAGFNFTYNFHWLSEGSASQIKLSYADGTKPLLLPQLTTIKSPTATVTLGREFAESADYRVNYLTITSPLEDEALIKSYTFRYAEVTSDFKPEYRWYNANGMTCTPQKNQSNRWFLLGIDLKRASASLPLYAFSYSQVSVSSDGKGTSPLPPLTCINKDYWGFANDNEARTGVPKLYIYPLLSAADPVPGYPYRLYPRPGYGGSDSELAGAERRPAASLPVALAGILTEVAFATGGKVYLDYEQHRFYDALTEQSQPAGGLRIRAVRLQDPVTRVETCRNYLYQTATGASSGVLLHWPHLVFSFPLLGKTQWAEVTVRSLEDLAPDPFESRHIGYRQVTEQVPGQGQVTTTFSVPGAADDNASAADPASGLPAWQRPVCGIARPACGNCASLAPLQVTRELYPFVPASNYDFCRGLPLTVQYRAEPTSTAVDGALVRQEIYSYQYLNAVSANASAVVGLRYEQFGNRAAPLYVYGKYRLLTDFIYTLRRQVVQLPVAGGTTNENSVDYRYTARGQLAAKIAQGSDNTLTRTRYKYLTDYAPFPANATGELLAMSSRVATDKVSSDLVETITEFRAAGSTGPLTHAGATLQTFASSTVPSGGTSFTTPTYPAGMRRWQPAQPVSKAAYDSVRVVGNSLYIPLTMREVSSVLATDLALTPLSVRTVAGRQVTGIHVGYASSRPLVQISHATAAEVVFSDFEAESRPYTFQRSSGAGVSAAAARTGGFGVTATAGEELTSALPATTATQYRLVFWARAPAAASSTSTITLASTQTTVFTRTVSHTDQWQRYDLLLPAPTNPTSYQVRLTAGGPVDFDDVFLAPASALVASTTYSLAAGKTSETDARGRTTFYEYGPTGDLALVRDQNRAIVRQYDKVLPGRTLTSRILFTTTGDQFEDTPLTFTAAASLTGVLRHRWEFGDGAVEDYPAGAENRVVAHLYPEAGEEKGYTVKLLIRTQDNTEYSCEQVLFIRPKTLQLTTCTTGVVAVDDCGHKGDIIESSCATSPPIGRTKFVVTPAASGNYTYQWSYADPANPANGWQPMTGETSAALTVLKGSLYSYRCRVTGSYHDVLSEEFSIRHYRSCQ